MKLKTRSAVAKRFRFTAKGKLKMRHSHMRHTLSPHRSRDNKRRLKHDAIMVEGDARRMEACLPYGN